ncbi:hypothetical protein V3C99_001079, partial [Haemonchus contortus]|uniref:Conserved plasma membrane protein n=1 Tax=Haemonchus contortus TaxID=6289 RepID=A0A7I4YDH1_HAECO
DPQTIVSCSTCHVHGLDPALYAYSCESSASCSFAHRCEAGCREMHWQSAQYRSELDPRSTNHGLPNNFSPVTRFSQGPSPTKTKGNDVRRAPVNHPESSSQESLPPTAEQLTDEWESDPEKEYNGKVLAFSLLIGIGCVILCSFWSLIRLLPVALIPFIYINRKTIFGEPSWSQNTKGEEESTTEFIRFYNKTNSDHTTVEDRMLWDRMTALESQNEQLQRELEEQRRRTDLLLKQMEDFTPRSCGTNSKMEVYDFPERSYEV